MRKKALVGVCLGLILTGCSDKAAELPKGVVVEKVTEATESIKIDMPTKETEISLEGTSEEESETAVDYTKFYLHKKDLTTQLQSFVDYIALKSDSINIYSYEGLLEGIARANGTEVDFDYHNPSVPLADDFIDSDDFGSFVKDCCLAGQTKDEKMAVKLRGTNFVDPYVFYVMSDSVVKAQITLKDESGNESDYIIDLVVTPETKTGWGIQRIRLGNKITSGMLGNEDGSISKEVPDHVTLFTDYVSRLTYEGEKSYYLGDVNGDEVPELIINYKQEAGNFLIYLELDEIEDFILKTLGYATQWYHSGNCIGVVAPMEVTSKEFDEETYADLGLDFMKFEGGINGTLSSASTSYLLYLYDESGFGFADKYTTASHVCTIKDGPGSTVDLSLESINGIVYSTNGVVDESMKVYAESSMRNFNNLFENGAFSFYDSIELAEENRKKE